MVLCGTWFETSVAQSQLTQFWQIPRQNAFLFTVNAIFLHDYPLAVEPGSTPRPLVQKKTWRDSLPIDMLLSAVSVLVVAQSSSEIPEGLMNKPVFPSDVDFWREITLSLYGRLHSLPTKLILIRGRDISVGIATVYGVDGPGIESRCAARFSAPVQTCPGAHPTSYTIVTWSFPGVKRPRRDVDHPPYLAPKLKKE